MGTGTTMKYVFLGVKVERFGHAETGPEPSNHQPGKLESNYFFLFFSTSHSHFTSPTLIQLHSPSAKSISSSSSSSTSTHT